VNQNKASRLLPVILCILYTQSKRQSSARRVHKQKAEILLTVSRNNPCTERNRKCCLPNSVLRKKIIVTQILFPTKSQIILMREYG